MVSALILAGWIASAGPLSAQVTGEIAFVGWNADGNDDIAFVTFVNIAGGTVLYFRDDEYNSGWVDANEGALSWTSPVAGIVAGTVVQIYDCASGPTVSTGGIAQVDASFNIAGTEEAVYMYKAAGWNTAPFDFIAAFCNATSFGNYLNGTGLGDGTNAWSWGAADNWRYNGIRTGTVAELQAALTNSANWSSATGSGDQSYTFDLSPFVIQSGAVPEIAVLGTNGAEIPHNDFSSALSDGTDFGSVTEAGSVAVTNTFSITNAGSAALILNGSPTVQLSGDADFTVLTQPASTNLAAGAVVTFQIKFDPSAAGTRTSLVSIASNDSNENPYLFGIRGTGAVPEIAVLGTNRAEVVCAGHDRWLGGERPLSR